MSDPHPETVICEFLVRAGAEERFREILRGHWPMLREVGLVTADPPQHMRGTDRAGRPVWIEIFTWRDGRAAGEAHENPAVAAIWGAMEECVEDREDRRKWNFTHYRRVELDV